MMTVRVGSRKVSFELVIPHREQHLSRELPSLSIFSPREVWGWKGLVQRHKEDSRKRKLRWHNQDSPRPGWRSSGRASVHRDGRVRKTQGCLELDKGTEVKCYVLPSPPPLGRNLSQEQVGLTSVPLVSSAHCIRRPLNGPQWAHRPHDWPLDACLATHPGGCSTCLPLELPNHLHFPF